MKFKKLLIAALALSPICAIAQKPQLIGLTNSIYSHPLSDFLQTDSTVYTYSGTAVYPNYDQALTSNYSYALLGYYYASKINNTYDGSGNLLTSIRQTCDTPSTWVNATQDQYAYDASNNMIVHVNLVWKSGAWAVNSREGMTYNSANDRITDTLYYNNKGYGPKSLYHYTYDGSHNVVSDTGFGYYMGNWYTSSRDIYTITGGKTTNWLYTPYNGKKSAWINYSQDAYTYDGGGNLASDIYQRAADTTGTTFTNVEQRSFSYTGPLMMSNDTATWNGSAWVPSTHDSLSYDASGNKIAQVNSYWSSGISKFVYATNEENTFDPTSNVILTSTVSLWNFPGWAYATSKGLGSQARYYYGTTGVHDVANAGGSLKLSPVPAINYVNLDLTWDAPQSAIIAVYDMTGKLCSQWQAARGTKYNASVPTANLQAGNYIIRIQGANGVISQQFSVIH